MADFVAVIRRAVDGLTDNTPEMRVRVYEKARGAVVRQLENMNPRPPEAMFKRQLDKLDAAIAQVEDENAEALPANEPPVEAEPVAQAAVEETVAQAPTPLHAEPLQAEPVQAVETREEPAEQPRHDAVEPAQSFHADSVETLPVEAQPVEAQQVHADPVRETAPVYEPVPMPATEPVRQVEAHQEPGAYAEPERYVETYREPAPIAETDPVPAYQAEVYREPSQEAAPVPRPEPIRYVEQVAQPETAQVAQPVDHAAEPVTDYSRAPVQDNVAAREPEQDPLFSHFEPAREPAIRHASNRVMEEPHFQAESEFPGSEPVQAARVRADQQSQHSRLDADFAARDREQPAVARSAAMPEWNVDIDREPEVVRDEPEPSAQMPRAALTETDVVSDFNDFVKNELGTPAVKPPPVRKEPEGDFSWDAQFDDLPDLPKPVAFQEALHARQEEMAKAPERQPSQQQRDARAELEDLIGYTPTGSDTAPGVQGDRISPEAARGMSKLERKSFKVGKKNKKRFNPIPIAFGVAGALVVAGGAYSAYIYRDDVSAMVTSLMPAQSKPTTNETADSSATETADSQTKGVAVNPDAAADDAAAKTDAATDEQPTEVASLDPNIGPSKFTQRLMTDGTETETDAAKVPVDPALSEGKTIAGQTQVASTDTSTPVEQTATAQTPGLGVTQKMFLYEERLGGSPVAVPGTVTWALKNDDLGNGKTQPLVEATIDVPERKLKAVVSFKRNNDPSLPASHIIEVVFDLPENFEEGNVESVQRVAFKQTEQDRGNSLIAVPAKITDDFHMIALNDDAEARKVNGDLMKTRSWIDIPVVYRNNRRALLTFEKGSTGTEAFDKALAQWAALGPTATSD